MKNKQHGHFASIFIASRELLQTVYFESYDITITMSPYNQCITTTITMYLYVIICVSYDGSCRNDF